MSLQIKKLKTVRIITNKKLKSWNFIGIFKSGNIRETFIYIPYQIIYETGKRSND